MSATLRDASGCLTETGVQALLRAPVGQAPPDLAAHVASCGRCQDKILAGAAGPEAPRERLRREAPPMWRTWAVLAAAILLTLVALAAGQWLTGR